MKVLANDLVRRYHLQFDAYEASLLRSIKFLPPRETPEPADLWCTLDEIHGLLEALPSAWPELRENVHKLIHVLEKTPLYVSKR